VSVAYTGGPAPNEQLGRTDNGNVGLAERWLAVAGGSGLALYGLVRRGPVGLGLAIVGGGLVYHGAAGRSPFYQALGINRANTHSGSRASVRHLEGTRVERSVTINRPAADLFQFWRAFENLPRIMKHLESVQAVDEQRSHWVASGPAGRRVKWDAEIVREVPNELIAWRSLHGSDIASAGSVRFRSAGAGRGTGVRVELSYDPPAGPLGAAIAAAFREEPGQRVHDDLLRFKEMMEAGEIATIDGQSSGRR
jgi:uncharacterized membrane protein